MTPGDHPPVTPGARLARELRLLADRLTRHEHADEQLADAADTLEQLRSALEGPRRVRWFEGPAPDVPPDPEHVRSTFGRWSLYRGSENPMAPPMLSAPVDHPDGRRVVGRVRCGRIYEGPPDGVHGGFVAGLFDDILGGAFALTGRQGVTGTLSIKYRRITPIDTDLVFTAWVHHVSGRRVVVRDECHADDVLTAEAEGLFVSVADYREVRRAGSAAGAT